MDKLLVICGPTATGKTKLALHLAKLFDGEVISADSRQVYKGLNIGTGKDLPINSKLKMQSEKLGGYYLVNDIKIWGYDLVEPNNEFSVSGYESFAKEIIKDINKSGKLPIIAGGTGLYIKGAVEGIPTSSVPKNKNLRESLKKFSVDELYEKLAEMDPIKAGNMNSSDNKNPRRLVRAIEIAQSYLTGGYIKDSEEAARNILIIGLKAPEPYLLEAIEKRVRKRISMGMENEVRGLLEKGVKWDYQSMTSLGYGIWRDYLEGTKTLGEVEKEWVREEIKYTKRQMTWFNNDERINWFDVTQENYPESVEKLVGKWYSSRRIL
jgi:tRNA dimethylallyltransferase